MKETRFLVCALVPLLAQCAYVEASGAESPVQKFSVDFGEILQGKARTNFLRIDVQTDDTYTLKRIEIFDHPDKVTNLTLTIPGEVDGKKVKIAPRAFQGMCSDKLRLHLIFKEANGNKVGLPAVCSRLFYASDAIASIDFSGADASLAKHFADMFAYCKNIVALDLRSFQADDTKEADINGMLHGCNNLRWLNVSHFKAANIEVRRLYSMFTRDIPNTDVDFADVIKQIKRQTKIITRNHNDEKMPEIYKCWNTEWKPLLNSCLKTKQGRIADRIIGISSKTPSAYSVVTAKAHKRKVERITTNKEISAHAERIKPNRAKEQMKAPAQPGKHTWLTDIFSGMRWLASKVLFWRR